MSLDNTTLEKWYAPNQYKYRILQGIHWTTRTQRNRWYALGYKSIHKRCQSCSILIWSLQCGELEYVKNKDTRARNDGLPAGLSRLRLLSIDAATTRRTWIRKIHSRRNNTKSNGLVQRTWLGELEITPSVWEEVRRSYSRIMNKKTANVQGYNSLIGKPLLFTFLPRSSLQMHAKGPDKNQRNLWTHLFLSACDIAPARAAKDHVFCRYCSIISEMNQRFSATRLVCINLSESNILMF